MISRALRTSVHVVRAFPRVVHRGISVKCASSALALLQELPTGQLLSQPSQEALNSISTALEGQQRAGWAWESPWDARVLAECIVALVELGGEGLPGGGVGGVEPPPALLFHPVRRCLRLLTQALSPRLPEVPSPLLLQAVCALASAGVVYAPLLRSIAGWVVAVEGVEGAGGGEKGGLATSAMVNPQDTRTFLATCDPEGIWGRLAARPGVVPKVGGLRSVPTLTLATTLAVFATSRVAPPQEFAPFYTLLLVELCSRGSGVGGGGGGAGAGEEEEGLPLPLPLPPSPPHSIEYYYGWHRDAVKDGVSTPNLPNWATLVPAAKEGAPFSGSTNALISPSLATALLELHPFSYHSSTAAYSTNSSNNPTSSTLGGPLSLELLSRTASSILFPALVGPLDREGQRLLLRDIPTVLKCLDCYPSLHSQLCESGEGGDGVEEGLIDTLLSRAVELITIEEEGGQERGGGGWGRKGQICYNCFGYGHRQAFCPVPRSRGVWGGGESGKASRGGSPLLEGYTIASNTSTATASSPSPVYNIKSAVALPTSSSSSEDNTPSFPSGGVGGSESSPSSSPPSSYSPHILSLLDHMTSHVFDVSTGRSNTPHALQLAPKLRLLTHLAVPFVAATAHKGVPLRYLSGFLYAHLCAGGGDPPPQVPYTVFLRDLGEALREPRAQSVFGGSGGGEEELQRKLLLQALWVCAGDGAGGIASSGSGGGGSGATAATDTSFPAAATSRARYEGRLSTKAAMLELEGGSAGSAAVPVYPTLSSPPPSSSSSSSSSSSIIQLRKDLMRGLVKDALSLKPRGKGDLPFLSTLALIATVGDAHPTTPLLFEHLLDSVNSPTSLALLGDHTFTLLVFSTAAAAIQTAVCTLPEGLGSAGGVPTTTSVSPPEALLTLLLKEAKGRTTLSTWTQQCIIDTLKALEYKKRQGVSSSTTSPYPLELSTLPPTTTTGSAPRVLETLLDAMECVVSAAPQSSSGGGGNAGILLPTFTQFPSLGRVSWAHPSMRLAVVLEESGGKGGGEGEGAGHTPLPPSLSHPLSLWRQRMLALLGWSCTRGVSVEAFMGASSARARSSMVVRSAQSVQQQQC